jgi:hypothetical protein
MGVATFEEVREEIRSLDPDDRLRRFLQLEERRRALEAESAVLLAGIDEDATYKRDGHASVFGLLRSKLGWSEQECRQRTQIARLVAAHPQVGESLFEAWVSVANVASIARAFANPRCGDQLESVLGTLMSEAQRMEHGDFRRLPERWQLLNDAGTRAEHGERHDRRNAHLSVAGDGGVLGCEWGAFDAVRNREVFDRFLEAEFEADWEATVAIHGDAASASLMPRTQAQRAADAVTAIFQRAAATPPGSKQPRPVGTVHIDWHTFQDWIIEHRLFPERHVDPFDDPSPLVSKLRCETGDGVLVDPDTVMQVLLEGYVRFVVQDDEGLPLRWGRERRLFTGAAREAVMSLSHRCTHAGCPVPSSRSEADHRTAWADGGTTDADNGDPRCRRHNRLRNHGFTVHRDHHGHWHTYRPDGTEI